MTPEPMSDEIAVLAEVITAGIPKALSRLEAGQFKRRADSLIRGFVSGLKSKLSAPIPPDVQAAIKERKQLMCEQIGYDTFTKIGKCNSVILNWAVSHFGEDAT